jgi:hypothetical protein
MDWALPLAPFFVEIVNSVSTFIDGITSTRSSPNAHCVIKYDGGGCLCG